MNLKQLEAFLAIARHGGFIEAAERLNLTQSTISVRIKELEQDLGVLLFDRSRRQIQLTPKGRCLSPLKLSHYCCAIGEGLDGSEAIFG